MTHDIILWLKIAENSTFLKSSLCWNRIFTVSKYKMVWMKFVNSLHSALQCVAPLPCPLNKPLDHFRGAVDGGCISFATGCILFAFSVSPITKTRQKRSPLIEQKQICIKQDRRFDWFKES